MLYEMKWLLVYLIGDAWEDFKGWKWVENLYF